MKYKPDYIEAENDLGFALDRAGRTKDAIEHFQHIVQINPYYLDARYNLCLLLVKTGQLQEAIKQYEQALRIKSDSPELHNGLGALLVNTGRSQEAIGHFKLAIRFKPDFALAYKNLTFAYAAIQQPSEAVATAQKALELAQSQGNTELARQIEDWLNSYRDGLRTSK